MMDQDLVAKAKRGNDDAFIVLIEQSKQKLFRIAFSIVKNEELAEECLQTTIVQAYQSIRKLKHDEYFETWLTKICLNACKKEYNRVKKLVELERMPEQVQQHDQNLLFFLDILTEEQKRLVSLKVFGEYTFDEIGMIENQSASTIKIKYYKAMKRLRVELKEEDYVG